MRDVLLMGVILPWAMFALRHPWTGVLLWVWVSLMNPHRFTYGFAYTAPVAMIAAVVTLVGFLFTSQKSNPVKGPPVVWFVLLTVWITVSWLVGLDPSGQFAQWDKVMKVNLMVFIALSLFRTKLQMFLLVWVLTLSVALLSAKGGLFTLLNAGAYRVWGPPGSWIEGNNDFAVATIMTIPLLRFMQLQVTRKWLSRSLGAMMLLSAISALGSHSRGALLSIVAMTTVLWWRSNNRARNGVVLLVLGIVMVVAMPSNWTDRMETIQTYQEDASALGRLSAWWVSFRIALNYPAGVGFNITSPDLFMAFSPYGTQFGQPVAHSIWFQMLGHHGFIGFLLFLAVWVSTWRVGAKLRRAARDRSDIRWVGDLGAMSQVCLVGYAVGGAFLQLGYYDFPYYVMAVTCICYAWVKREAWNSDVIAPGGWRSLIGVASEPAARGDRAPLAGDTAGLGGVRPAAVVGQQPGRLR